jgi:hypothetical protein
VWRGLGRAGWARRATAAVTLPFVRSNFLRDRSANGGFELGADSARGVILRVTDVTLGVTFIGLAHDRRLNRNQATDRQVPRGGEASARRAAAKAIGALPAHPRGGRGISDTARNAELLEKRDNPRLGPASAARAEDGWVVRRLFHRSA